MEFEIFVKIYLPSLLLWGVWVYNNKQANGEKVILYSWVFLLSCSTIAGAVYVEAKDVTSKLVGAIAYAIPHVLVGPFLLSALKHKWSELCVYLGILVIPPTSFIIAFVILLLSNQMVML